MTESEKRELMLEMEEQAELEGYRNYAKLGSEFSIPSEVILKLDNKAEKQAVDAADELLENAIGDVESDLSTLDGVAVKHSLAGAVSDFLVGAGTTTFTFVKKTLAEVKTILGLGSAAYTASTDYAVSGKGVTNGDSHDHVGGDGSQVDHGGLGGLSDDDHSQYLRADATRVLSADWDIGNTRMIQADKIRARDADGLALYDKDGNGIFVKDGGNVGIGTTNPVYKLEVNGILGFTALPGYGSSWDSTISYARSTPYDILTILSKGGGGTWQGRINFDLSYNDGSPYTIMTLVDNGGSGNVGIGTTVPSAKLAINGGLAVGEDVDPGDNNLKVVGNAEIDGALNHDGTTVGFYGVTPVTKGSGLTAQLTTITCSAPGTPDYAIADPVQNTGFGFTASDEMLSVLKVIANLQVRVAELEARLGSSTGAGLFT